MSAGSQIEAANGIKMMTARLLLAAYAVVTVSRVGSMSVSNDQQEPRSLERIATSLEGISRAAQRNSTERHSGIRECPEFLEGPDVPCVRMNKHCFCFNTRKLNWADAELFCKKHGMNLISVNSAWKETIVLGLLSLLELPPAHYWSSGSDAAEEGKWVWTATGQVIGRHQNWHKNQPDDYMQVQDCLIFAVTWGEVTAWDDNSCNGTQRSVCEA